jgi:hypothetical protein
MSVESSPPGYSGPLTAGTAVWTADGLGNRAGLKQLLNQCA